ncbi:MAG: ADP-glyceromanno-heptose 6-epimerase [Micavibrio sp.]|nr:ADP-glyceromanno-heptose 6-epimerase [Micavibrio sp.]|tara:strand:+ start:1298 stop:2287 length:990 start_codon:yes stop_codon:yes gene_type:complete
MIIITGGAGFIGSNLAAKLQEEGITDIVICDMLGKDNKWKNFAKRELKDIVRPDALFEYMNGYKDKIDAIFHLGAVSSTTEYDADLVVNANFVFSRNLWKWAANNDVPLFYASSYATYGDGSAGFEDDDTPEGLEKLLPLNPFGWSKHLFDRRIARIAQDKTEKMPPQWAGLKFFNAYGPNEYHMGSQQSVVSTLYPQITVGASAKLFKSYNPEYKDGEQKRDFVYVRDIVDVLYWFYKEKPKSGIYNIGTGEARSFNDLANAIFGAVKMEPKISYIDMPDTLRDKYQYITEASNAKLKAAGYDKPFTSLEDGVKDYIDNYLSQKDQYR